MKTLSKIGLLVSAVAVAGCVSVKSIGFDAYYKITEALPFVNTSETMLKQTDIYGMIVSHFEMAEEGKVPKAVVINFDGCRADALLNLDENSTVFKNAAGGGLYLMYTGGEGIRRQFTSTSPGFTTQLTGVWAKGRGGHGVVNNGRKKRAGVPIYTNTVAEIGFRTAFFYTWADHAKIFGADFDYVRFHNLPASYVRCLSDEYKDDYDKEVRDRMIEAVTDGCDLIFGIFEATDASGHGKGFGFSPEYKAAVVRLDSYAGEVIESIRRRTAYDNEDWLIVITTDHGGIGTGHGGQSVEERTIWMSVNREIR